MPVAIGICHLQKIHAGFEKAQIQLGRFGAIQNFIQHLSP
jgi:hypothetical protein